MFGRLLVAEVAYTWQRKNRLNPQLPTWRNNPIIKSQDKQSPKNKALPAALHSVIRGLAAGSICTD